ncbi:MAG: TRAP transporter small permease subunit [Syntrophotaleaceae bacterium]
MMHKMLKNVDRSLGFVEDWSLFIAVAIALLVAMANVVLRKLTPISLYWSDEVVKRSFFYYLYRLQRGGAQAGADSYRCLAADGKGVEKPLTVFSHLAVVVFAAFMVRYGWTMTVSAWNDPFARTATLEIPEYLFYAVLPLMGGMLLVRTLLVLIEDWRGESVE